MVTSMLPSGSGTCLQPLKDFVRHYGEASWACMNRGADVAVAKNSLENAKIYEWAKSDSGFGPNAYYYWLGYGFFPDR